MFEPIIVEVVDQVEFLPLLKCHDATILYFLHYNNLVNSFK